MRRIALPLLLAAPPALAAPTAVTLGEPAEPVGLALGPVDLTTPSTLALSATSIGRFPVDGDGTQIDGEPALDALLRVGLVLDSARMSSTFNVRLEAEYELVGGIFSGGTTPSPDVLDAPLVEDTDHTLRKASGRVTLGPFLTVGGGFMTSYWGLGLIANDGAHGWEPGSARFTDPRGGDRVLRAFALSGPWTDAKLMVIAAVDQVQGDDVLRAGDEATQAIAAVTVGDVDRRHLGLYGVYRMQTTRDGAETNVTVGDVFGRWSGRLANRVKYTAALESALIVGETDLGPSTEFPTHDVFQLGVAAEAAFDAGSFGGVLSAFFASGDRDAADGEQNAFKADVGFEQGLLLYKVVLAGQSGRGPITAADPDLVGYPADDLDRLTTRGAVTNTFALFPRVWGRPLAGLEVYGGPLFAWSAVEVADPRASRLAGGVPTNVYGGTPGGYLGTELDVGVRYRVLAAGATLTAGLEAGVFTPGSAFEDAEGNRRGALQGARLSLEGRL